jgi:hypothetical protein
VTLFGRVAVQRSGDTDGGSGKCGRTMPRPVHLREPRAFGATAMRSCRFIEQGRRRFHLQPPLHLRRLCQRLSAFTVTALHGLHKLFERCRRTNAIVGCSTGQAVESSA